MKLKFLFLTPGLLTLLATTATAAILGASGNFEINQFGVSGDRDRSLAGAVGGQPGYVIQSFVLPTLGAGQSFQSASFIAPVGVFFNAGGNNSGFDLDLFGLTQNSNLAGYNSTLPMASMTSDPATLLQFSFVDHNVVTGTSQS